MIKHLVILTTIMLSTAIFAQDNAALVNKFCSQLDIQGKVIDKDAESLISSLCPNDKDMICRWYDVHGDGSVEIKHDKLLEVVEFCNIEKGLVKKVEVKSFWEMMGEAGRYGRE